MRLLFAGTPSFAALALEAILEAGHDVPLVLTQPDRPSGRGMRLTPSPVKALAQKRGIEVFQPVSLKDADSRNCLVERDARLMVVAAYGLILPQPVLDAFPLGCINIHASLLPRWRGAAPIQRAIEAGDSMTGITIMQMEAGLDTGPMLLRAEVPIRDTDTAATLHDTLADVGARLVVEALEALENGALGGVPQDAAAATYAAKIGRGDAAIDWQRTADEIDRQIRAFNPVPGATTRLRGETIKIWSANRTGVSTSRQPGEIIAREADSLMVACGDGRALALTTLQRAGGRRLPAPEFLQGFPVETGERLQPPED